MNEKVEVIHKGSCVKINGVKYHHHCNGGGLVAETARVAKKAFVDICSRVCERAKVRAGAKICGSLVEPGAEVSGAMQLHNDVFRSPLHLRLRSRRR